MATVCSAGGSPAEKILLRIRNRRAGARLKKAARIFHARFRSHTQTLPAGPNLPASRRRYKFMRLSRLVVWLAAAACLSSCSKLSAPPTQIRIGLNSGVVSFDPHRTNESNSFLVNCNIYDSLVQ